SWSRRGQDLDGAAVDGDLPGAVPRDLQDLVDELRHLDLEVVVALCRWPGLVEPQVEGPHRAGVSLADHRRAHQVRVVPGVGPAPVLADQAHVLGPDVEGERATRLRQVGAGRRARALEELAAP